MKMEAYLSLEASVASTMEARWLKIAHDLIGQLHPLIEAKKFNDAHACINSFSLNGIVETERKRIEELLTSAILFGAQNLTPKLSETELVKGNVSLPPELKHAIDQLEIMIEQDGADQIRKLLHDLVREYEIVEKTKAEDFDPSKSTLYVSRDLLECEAFLKWAKEQGFASTLDPDDLHVTICYSKEPTDWKATPAQSSPITVSGGTRDIKQFGDAVVLTFTSEALQARHDEFISAGASFDFDEYRPHITITYQPGAVDLSKVLPFEGDLYFSGEIFQPIKEGWADDLEETSLKKAADLALAEQLNAAVMGGGKAVIDIGANLTTTRLVALGFLGEAKGKGVTKYQISAILDDKTCPVCRYMDGKSFEVESEYSKVISALTTQDPQQLKHIAPWPKQTKAGLHDLNKMSLHELQKHGYGSPPFHPICRCQLVSVGTVKEQIPLHGMQLPELPEQVPTTQVPLPAVAPEQPSWASRFTPRAGMDPNAENFIANGFVEKSNIFQVADNHVELPEYVNPSDLNNEVIKYIGSGFSITNRYLRGVTNMSAEQEMYAETMIGGMDAVMKPVTQDFIAYRGMPMADFKMPIIGQDMTLTSYTSSSISAEIALDFLNANKENVFFQILVPNGTRAIVTNADEAEMILGRGTKFKVLDIIDKSAIPDTASPKAKKRIDKLVVLEAIPDEK